MSPLLFRFTLLLAPILVAALWQAALLALATAAFLRLLPSLSAAARSRIWTAAFLLAAVLPLTMFFFPRQAAGAAVRHGEMHATLSAAFALVSLWCAASALRAVQLFRSAFHLRIISSRATPIACAERSAAEICISSDVDVPSIAGFFHPRILIPAELYATLTPADLHHIVLHESEHLRRRDDWTNLLQKLTLVLFPISPALLWMERRLCLERELACDDGVLRATGATRAYASTLANLAEHSFLRRTLSLALQAIGAIRHPSEVARRIQRILSQPAAELSSRSATLASTFALAGILGAAICLARAPQLIVFTPSVATIASTAISTEPFHAAPASWFGPRPTLAKAAMPLPRPASFQLRRVHPRVVHHIKPAVPSASQQWIVLTTLHASPANFPPARIERVRFNVDAPDQVPVLTYAAVPTRMGWLIIQL